jgi:hypothetical protein
MKDKKLKITARDVLEALRVKHADDVFVDECKDGPSQGEHFRLDAWVMNRSWANAVTTGYEIKVSRSDFLKDEKWRAYLSLCNQFYFVCPRGLITPSELPPEAGLYYISNTGGRLLVQKKAPHRGVEIPETVYRYILMCRTVVTRDRWMVKDKLQFWRDFINEKAEKRRLGCEVSKAIRESVSHVEVENMRLQQENESLTETKDALKRLGIGRTFGAWDVARKVAELRKAVPNEFTAALNSLLRSAESMKAALTALEQKEGQEEAAA